MSPQRLLRMLVVAPLVMGLLGHQAAAASQRAEVEQAFNAVQRGDFGPVSALAQQGEAIADSVQPYLSSPHEAVRREAVALLSTIGGTSACEHLVSALADPSADIRSRAGFALVARCDLAAIRPTNDRARHYSTACGLATAQQRRCCYWLP
jgi:HEAT repeat protein